MRGPVFKITDQRKNFFGFRVATLWKNLKSETVQKFKKRKNHKYNISTSSSTSFPAASYDGSVVAEKLRFRHFRPESVRIKAISVSVTGKRILLY